MADTIGSLLEKARVAKGLTPEQVTAKTRISATFIRAVEADRFDDLPGKVVVRGFLKTYATLLDLDPDELLARYDEMGITAVDKSPELISMPLNRSPLGPKIALYGGLALLVGLTASVYWFFGSPPPPPPPAIATPAPTVAPEENSVERETADDETTTDVTPEPTATPTATPTDPPAASTAEATVDPLKDATRPHKLVIKATSDSWLKVVVDGEETREIVLRAGKTVVWYGEKDLVLNIGNVAGVAVYYNNEAAPLPEAPRNILTNLHYPPR